MAKAKVKTTGKKLYCYSTGFSIPGVDAEDAYLEVARIEEEHGEVTPEILIEESRDPDAPLHLALEWDDKLAADAHRHDQARRIIRSVGYIIESTVREVRKAEIFVETTKSQFRQGFMHIPPPIGSGRRAGSWSSLENLIKDKPRLSRGLEEALARTEAGNRAFGQLIDTVRELSKESGIDLSSEIATWDAAVSTLASMPAIVRERLLLLGPTA